MRLIDGDALEELFREVIGSIAKKPEMDGSLEHMVRASAMVIEMIKDAPTIEPEQKWIPCSDVPDTDRNVLIARGRQNNMTVCIGHYNHKYQQWYEDRNWFAQCLYDGLYWCEIPSLPEPYGGEPE